MDAAGAVPAAPDAGAAAPDAAGAGAAAPDEDIRTINQECDFDHAALAIDDVWLEGEAGLEELKMKQKKLQEKLANDFEGAAEEEGLKDEAERAAEELEDEAEGAAEEEHIERLEKPPKKFRSNAVPLVNLSPEGAAKELEDEVEGAAEEEHSERLEKPPKKLRPNPVLLVNLSPDPPEGSRIFPLAGPASPDAGKKEDKPVLVKPDRVHVTAVTMLGRHTLDCEASDTIHYVKARIQLTEGQDPADRYSMDEKLFMHNTKTLKRLEEGCCAKDLKLSDYNIQNGDAVHLFLCQCGPMWEMLSSSESSKRRTVLVKPDKVHVTAVTSVRSYTLDFEASDRIHDVKARIQQQDGYARLDQALFIYNIKTAQ